MKFYIKMHNEEFGSLISFIELDGDRVELSLKLRDLDFVKSIGMPDVYWFDRFELLDFQQLQEHKKLGGWI
jgi:hypothetical protein